MRLRECPEAAAKEYKTNQPCSATIDSLSLVLVAGERLLRRRAADAVAGPQSISVLRSTSPNRKSSSSSSSDYSDLLDEGRITHKPS